MARACQAGVGADVGAPSGKSLCTVDDDHVIAYRKPDQLALRRATTASHAAPRRRQPARYDAGPSLAAPSPSAVGSSALAEPPAFSSAWWASSPQ
jgi:hypothetical protein